MLVCSRFRFDKQGASSSSVHGLSIQKLKGDKLTGQFNIQNLLTRAVRTMLVEGVSSPEVWAAARKETALDGDE